MDSLIIKRLIENKIKFLDQDIKHYTEICHQKRRENEDVNNLSVYKYEQNKQVITLYEAWIDDLSAQLEVYRHVLEVINMVIDAPWAFKEV